MKTLERFIIAQNEVYPEVLKELKMGLKVSHWMWFIFPQIKGLGQSETATYYSIQNKEEAISYLECEILRKRYDECCEILLALDTSNPIEVFGYLDSLKLKSSLTLFYYVSNNSLYLKLLQKFFNGKTCDKTIFLLEQEK